jgi:opacity protein-like surface antigen
MGVSVGTVVMRAMLVTTMCAAPAAAQEVPVGGRVPLVSRVAVQSMVREEPAPPAPELEQAPPAVLAPPPSPPSVAQPIISPVHQQSHNQWIGSVLFGTNFQANTANDVDFLDIDADNNSEGAASFAFSGQIGYVWRNVGIEGLFDFTPSVDVTRMELEDPSVNSYMVNVVAAIPFGPERRFLPYLSGGIGAVVMKIEAQDIFFPELNDAVGFTGSSESKFGWNLGIGASAFGAGPIGFRADVRYFRAASNSEDDLLANDLLDLDDSLGDGAKVIDTPATDRLTRQILSGIGYWRANVGVAFRW